MGTAPRRPLLLRELQGVAGVAGLHFCCKVCPDEEYSDEAGCGSVSSGKEVTSSLTPGICSPSVLSEEVPSSLEGLLPVDGAGDWGSPSQEVAKLPDPSKLALLGNDEFM